MPKKTTTTHIIIVVDLAKYTYDKLCSDIVNYCSLEIDRLDNDPGDNWNSLKHCKSAFAAI